MRTRTIRDSDIPILQGFVSDGKEPYPDLGSPLIEMVCVVVDADDKPIAACAAERMVQAWMYVDESQSPAVKIDAIRLIHQDGIPQLRSRCYHSMEAFPTGPLAVKFGRRLERTFGWIENIKSWTLRF